MVSFLLDRIRKISKLSPRIAANTLTNKKKRRVTLLEQEARKKRDRTRTKTSIVSKIRIKDLDLFRKFLIVIRKSISKSISLEPEKLIKTTGP